MMKITKSQVWPALAGVIVLASLAAVPARGATGAVAQARQILDLAGTKGGIVVQLGCGKGELTAALRASEAFQVQGLDRSAENVAAAREAIYQQGVYGPVAAELWVGNELPYIDNFVNLLVAEKLEGVSQTEVLRVLVPNGVACVKEGEGWKKIVKPWPGNIDEWTHYFYDARGNVASHDQVTGPPRRLQWVGNPRWSRHHDRMSSLNAQVSAAGRLYYIMDEGSRLTILTPSHWVLTARDAFNGTVLWKKPMEKWSPHLWPLKTGPTQLTRRLVAAGENIFVTLGIEAPVTCVDGATGKALRTYEETTGAEEILHVNGVLYTLVNPAVNPLENYAPKLQQDQARVAGEYAWDEKPRRLVAVEAATGRTLWRKDAKVAPLTLVCDGKRLIYSDGQKLISLSAATGTQNWASQPVAKRRLFEYNYGPRTVLHQEVLLYAGGEGSMRGFNANTGKQLWEAPHAESGYRSPEDLIVASGLVWNAPTIQGTMSGEYTGRDPATGEVKAQFPSDTSAYFMHHRCYIAKATDRYIVASRTGVEFVDLEKKHWNINHWVRGACLYGTMPCNGLTYAGPHNCACYPEAKLDGMNALAPELTTPLPKAKSDEERLEKGPAYGQALAEKEADANDWPTYRHDATRSGFTRQPLASNLDPAWNAKLGGRLSALTIAAGKVFVAQVDQHVVHALDAGTGKAAWKFFAGARVDSPPTYWKGRVLFGSTDGYVYCLRAEDGALIWRFQAAPYSRRNANFEQVESVWPVHGSVLVENGVVSCVAGRSVFLDGGLHFIRLDAATGKKVVEVVYDDKDPENGKPLQDRIAMRQMPVGLNDVLAGDGKYIYLRSQKILPDGKRVDLGPVSGNAMEQASAQHGEGSHIFAPYGYLDDSWFHRSYWVYGRNYAGGAEGYPMAGKFAPAGQMLVFDDKNVYGYGRLPQYLRWTTTMERQMFSTSKEAPEVKLPPGAFAGPGQGKAQAGKAQPGKAQAGKAGQPGKAGQGGKALAAGKGVQQGKAQKARPGAREGRALSESVAEGNPAYTPPLNAQPVRNPNQKDSYVEHQWDAKVPLYTCAMAMAGRTLFISGPPDTIDEEYAFERLTQKDKEIQKALAEQDDALKGKKGALLRTMSADTGKSGPDLNLESLPVWDGMSVAQGRVFIATQDGKVTCFGTGK